MAYTDEQLDIKFAELQKQIRLKSPAADISALTKLNSDNRQTTTNLIGDIQGHISDLQRANASLTQRLREVHTRTITTSYKLTDTVVNRLFIHVAQADSTISSISFASYDGTCSLRVINNSLDVFSIPQLTSSSILSITSLQNDSVSTGYIIEVDVTSVVNDQTLVVQIDLSE